MAGEAEKKIYRLSTLCGLVTAAALVIPRFARNPEGGFAGAANATVALMSLLAVSFLLSLYLLGVTVTRYRDLSPSARVAGIGPGVVLGLALLGLFFFLGY